MKNPTQNPIRNGKIARLPKALRDQLNQRLQDGVQGTTLVDWLNGLPEVQALVQSQFDGHPIREQNLSQWKSGGYRDWVHQQEALELARHVSEDTEELDAAQEGRKPLCASLEQWLVARYTVATREIAATKGPKGWRLLRQMCADVVKLRRIQQHNERLALERERMALRREQLKFERELAAPEEDPWGKWNDDARIEWARIPENRVRICSWKQARDAMQKHNERCLGRETESDRKGDAEVREWLAGLREEHKTRPWTEEEKFAWVRLPENLDRIMFKEGRDPVEAMRYIRGILDLLTEEDRAYYAQMGIEVPPPVHEYEPDPDRRLRNLALDPRLSSRWDEEG
ncbi:MAG: hypothetical protein P4L99_11610 [Chthoniobacter sp.]|nr:hypothetical protein [Chthoniobacter sp.]